jgi:transcriptional regulator with XRE-family HTH domain
VAKVKPHVIIGRNIHRLRNELGMTQETLAEKASVDRRSLQRIEAGQWNMTVDYLDRLRGALGCTWSQLIERL